MTYFNEEYLKNCDKETIVYLYNNQYEKDNIPEIDMIEEEGDIIYRIYCYSSYSKYLCRVFKN